MDIHKADWGYVPLDPDPDFDAEKNQKIIDNVIRSNERNRKRRKREQAEEIGERSSAAASYIKSVARSKSNMSVDDYFGKRYLTELRGKQIINKLKDAKKREKR